jgi:carboxylesterase type B
MLLGTVLASVLFVASSVNGQSDGLTISTKEGAVTGTQRSAGVRQFLGIPYATAGRWEAPKPAPKRSSAFAATKYGDSCVQTITKTSLKFYELAGLPTTPIPESEDCLSVNIWAPSTPRKQGTAVMVWVYGGSFQFGSVRAICTIFFH